MVIPYLEQKVLANNRLAGQRNARPAEGGTAGPVSQCSVHNKWPEALPYQFVPGGISGNTRRERAYLDTVELVPGMSLLRRENVSRIAMGFQQLDKILRVRIGP